MTEPAAQTPGAARAARLLDRLAVAERVVTFVAFLVLIAVVFLDVVSREITGRGLHWALQAGVYANIVVVLVGLGLASAGGTHLRPQFADRLLPAAWEPVVVRVQEFLMAAFCAAFMAVAFAVVLETRSLGERSAVLGNPIWPIQSLFPLVFGVAAVRHFLYGWYPALRPAPDPSTGE